MSAETTPTPDDEAVALLDRVQTQARQDLLFDQGREFGRDLQSSAIFINGHGEPFPAAARL